MSKSVTAIKQLLASYITTDYPNLDTSEGSPVDDIVINPPAQELSKFYDNLDIISENQSKDTATSRGLDVLMSNISLTRKSASTSTGFITFFANTQPLSDISIPLNTTISTLPSNNSVGIQFLTTQNATMYVAIISQYYNPTTNKYEITVPIESVETGSSNNVGPSTITSIITPIIGIDGCYNLNSTTGATDTELDSDVRTRIQARWSGGTLGTIDGIYSLVNANKDVLDVLVVGGGNTGRDEFGAIDVYVKGQVQTQRTDIIYTIPNSTISDIIFQKQPVLLNGILSVISSGSGSIPSSYYSLTKDTGPFQGSINAIDQLHWNNLLNSNVYGSLFVTYVYNSLIESLQTSFNQTNQNIVEVSLLVKQAIMIPINITCTLKILSGYDIPTVQTNVSNALSDFFSALKIGAEVQQSDVIGAIIKVSGVDDVKVPLDTFQSSDGTILKNSSGNLTIPYNS